jgi:hypothetical protein
MNPAGPGTNNDCTSEIQQNFTLPDPITSLQKAAVTWLTFLLRIPEVAISILGPEPAYPTEVPAQKC